jgi:outer membrane protein W
VVRQALKRLFVLQEGDRQIKCAEEVSLINASFWRIDIDTDATFNSALGTVQAKVDIDRFVYMISLGYKF